uniref:Uncharacterized protein n=1 Tax=Escherichia coli TaxID=562 RepID=A0A075MG89_ECOLX|nr:hypothetical protein [Escherichia coli]
MDGEIKTLNSRLSSSIHARDAEMKTLAGKRNELAQASAKYKELDELVKKLSPRANDPIRFRTVLFLKQPDDGLGPVRLEKKNKNR